jgi:hypothetical protein
MADCGRLNDAVRNTLEGSFSIIPELHPWERNKASKLLSYCCCSYTGKLQWRWEMKKLLVSYHGF